MISEKARTPTPPYAR